MVKKITFCTYDAPLFHSVNSWLKRLLPELSRNNFKIQALIFYEGDLTDCETYKFLTDLEFDVKVFPFKSLTEEKIKWTLQTLSVDPPDIFVPNMLVNAFFTSRWLKASAIPSVGVIHSDEKFYDGLIDVFVTGDETYKLTSIVTVSKYLFNRINLIKPPDVINRCIPCGVPIANAPTTSFTGTTLKLIYIGRLADKQKRISAVVKSMCKASNQIEGVEGIIYGHGDVNRVMRLLKKYSTNDKVKFGGSLSNSEVFNALSTAQVFVLLSDFEGLPQSLLEAMACGLVPVCTDIKSGIPELITHGQTGVIVKNRTSSFVKAIQKLKTDRALCEEISRNVKNKVIPYSIEACVVSWTNLLNELLPGNNVKKPITIPAEINLPKPHPYLKGEDFRTPSALDDFKRRIKKSKAFQVVKKIILNR